jgi:hypothetical protein
MNSDHADEELVAEPNPLGTITAMAIDPSDSRIIYVAAGDKKKGPYGLFVSRDGAANWMKQDDLPGLANRLWVNPHSPGNARTLFIAGAHFMLKKSPAQNKNIPIPNVKGLADLSMGFTPQGRPIFYVVGDQAAFVSAGEEGTWGKVDLGSGSAKIRAIATSLEHPEIAYLSYRELDQDGIKWMGVAKTADAGQTWKLVWKEDSSSSAKPAANVHDAWITERFGSDWGENPLALGVADQDANLCYATDLGRAMHTTDGGVSWNALYSRKSR